MMQRAHLPIFAMDPMLRRWITHRLRLYFDETSHDARKRGLFSRSLRERETPRMRGGVRSRIRTGLHLQFPAIRENNREICDSGPLEANFVARNHCAAATFYEIPYAN
jgi:hypothetical protein